MQRFDGQPLGNQPHLAVLFQDKLGGFVVATPLLRGLKEKYPSAVLDYFGGDRTEQLETACPYIDARYSLYGSTESIRSLGEYVRRREQEAGPYDLAINLDNNPLNALVTGALSPRFVVGRSFLPDGRGEFPPGDTLLDTIQDPSTFWSADDFMSRYGEVVHTNFIGEIFCRLARVDTDFQKTEVATAEVPFVVPTVLIATGATRRAKLWPVTSWKRWLERCDAENITVGLLGAAPGVQAAAYRSGTVDAELLACSRLVDLRGRLTLPEVAGALRQARVCVTIDTGVMHLAAAVGTPTLALFGASSWDLWAPRVPWLHLVLPTEPCPMCHDNHFLNDACLRDRHVCMLSISPDSVFNATRVLLLQSVAENG
ncbi:MAG TPA: glycosyltransferase family 9 protein [Chloroflexota bacterium]|nr:glycosyltransferase family 9 protein [Chloroflexota bacterium]